MAERRDFGTIRRLPSGRYQATYIGPDLGRHKAPSTFEKRDLAVVWLRNEQRMIEDAVADELRWVSPEERLAASRRKAEPKVRFGEYGAKWIVERRNSKGEPLRALTRKDYELVLAKYLVPTFGDRPIDQITRADVRTWHTKVGTAAPRTRAKAYGLLRAIMNTAVDDELIAASPVHIRGAGAQAIKRKVEPATPAEIELMADAMPPRLRASVIISAWCALRYGELAELRRKDIDVKRQLIRVRRAVTFPPGGPVVGPPKSDAGVRDVSIPPHIWPVVEEHLKEYVRPTPDALLFPSEGRGHIWHSGMNNYFSKARTAAGREDLKWHDLRHTGATLAAQVGATTAELQARLGHSTSVAAQLYQHAAKDRDRHIAERLSRLVDGT
ncbi:putative prophage phiRv2 integrase [Micropruina glycogenica]|uniref:Putative prophage phiRv2 integrase n=1 Tax=Micropruina glycogenica TaxID=75385 RepID=A0A2N9JAR3_9ACTN|nr:putative prophage phiRv2 integrase [Micropruina glycogenica]